MKVFATRNHPIRASSIPNLFQCPQSVVLRAMFDDSGEAAQTGSLVHVGINFYHTEHSMDAGIAAMSLSQHKFPLANGVKAMRHFKLYCSKEKEFGEVIECEEKIEIVLPPHESDPTQEDIVILGTKDQVRVRNGKMRLLADVKTGSTRANDMISFYQGQLAAYQYASDCEEAWIIRTADLIYGGDVFHRSIRSMKTAKYIVDQIPRIVAQVRRGELITLPGKHCAWCPARDVEYCKDGAFPPAYSTANLPDELPMIGTLL